MNAIKIAAIGLMAAGILGLAYGKFSYTSPFKVVLDNSHSVCHSMVHQCVVRQLSRGSGEQRQSTWYRV